MRKASAILVLLLSLSFVAACGGDDDDDAGATGDVDTETTVEDVEEEPTYDAAVAASACTEFGETTIDASNAEQFRETANKDGMPADLQALLLQLVDAGEASDQDAAAALFPEIDALCTDYMAEAG